MNFRFSRRMAVSEPVLLRGATGEVVEGTLTEISLSGARVRTSARWDRSFPLVMLVGCRAGSRGGEAEVLATAQVIRATADGLAVEWVGLAPPLMQARLR